MTPRAMRHARILALIVAACAAIVISSCDILPTLNGCMDGECAQNARVCREPTIRALAHDLDELEAHIERNGSVVIQHPSVWGQARLTKHREDFEKQMAAELPNFALTLNGSLSRSDQAYFANATALGMAVSGPQALIRPPTGRVVVANSSAAGAAAPTPIAVPTPDFPTGAFDAFSNVTRTPVTLSPRGFANIAKGGVTLEPTLFLDQKKRYLDHLNEIRRINEGDDTADSPGYALNLIRIPVSVLPGKCTDQGYGAEVTMTLKPYLSEELLPTTFRNLVVNDLLEVIGVPLTQFLNDKEQAAEVAALWEVYDIEKSAGKTDAQIARLTFQDLSAGSKAVLPKHTLMSSEPKVSFGQQRTQVRQNVRKVFARSSGVISATKLRHSKRPFPPSQTLDIFGEEETDNVVIKAIRLFQRDPANKYWKHYTDVQGYLQEELAGAYRFLADPNHWGLWEYCSPALVTAIHTRNVKEIERTRQFFAADVQRMTAQRIDQDVTVGFAWAIIVESALLNKQLIDDIKESAAAKGCACSVTDGHGALAWLDFYRPQPSPTARQAFNEYVQCRWPIIVFALDPATDQQNIADAFSQRREMQLAMSLAFVSGQVSARNMMRFARRIESEIETVAINNTAVGFSHGNETFGWRFYPRFQTPDIEGNATVFFRDLMLGGPNRKALLRQWKLEPGPRECVAIVIMPSFVPYASLDVSSDWFSLTNPKHKKMSSTEAVKLSERVKSLENCVHNVTDQDCYRSGELPRLENRIKQLEARLPLQNMQVQIPYENTLGGFAMFNTGITDLAPELYGWYGAPGVNLNDNTTLFLIGNHFSVHQTRVIVGGLPVTDTEMLSRQVMRVTIPKGALPLDRLTGKFPDDGPATARVANGAPIVGAEQSARAHFGTPTVAGGAEESSDQPHGAIVQKPGEVLPPPQVIPPVLVTKAPELFVDVHVATPYGVTSHLLIPAVVRAATAGGSHVPTPGPTMPAAAWVPKVIELGYVPSGVGIAPSSPPTIRPADLTIQLSTPVNPLANVADLKFTVSGAGTNVTADITVAGLTVRDQQTFVFSNANRNELVTKIFDKIGPQYGKTVDPQKNAARLTLTAFALRQDTQVLAIVPANADLAINWVAP